MKTFTARMRLLLSVIATTTFVGCGDNKPKDEPAPAGGITSGGYIVEQIPEALSKRGIEVRRAPLGLEIYNFGKELVKVIPGAPNATSSRRDQQIGWTVSAGEMALLKRDSDLSGVKLLEIRDASDSFLGTIDVESYLQTSRSPE